MNARQAKKMGSYPCDPEQKPSATSPYTDGQIIESGRVYHRALRRGDRNGRVKWSSVRPSVYRSRWRPGLTGSHLYGPERQRA